MKKMKLGLSAAALMCAFSMSANASVCTWSIDSISSSNVTKTITNTYACLIGTSSVATKTWVTTPSGNPTCSISVSTGYTNLGTCVVPNVVESLPTYTSGQKVCEFNDPVTGTTPGCTEEIVNATGNNHYYLIKKDGHELLSITKTYLSPGCVVSGSNANFYVANTDCTNYRIHAY